MAATIDILGRGFSFPLRTDERGGVAASAGERKVIESIQVILGTLPGERLMRPTFGCLLKTLIFAPNHTATASLARFYVEDALTRWEPRIALDLVDVRNLDTSDGPSLVVQVRYRFRASGAAQQLAFEIPLAP